MERNVLKIKIAKSAVFVGMAHLLTQELVEKPVYQNIN